MNILITGGSRGIGKAIALELNKARHNLLLVAKTLSNLEQAKAKITDHNLRTKILACDLSKECEIENLHFYSEEFLLWISAMLKVKCLKVTDLVNK